VEVAAGADQIKAPDLQVFYFIDRSTAIELLGTRQQLFCSAVGEFSGLAASEL